MIEYEKREMKTIKIVHWRCDEPQAYTYALCPDEWDSEIIDNKLYDAQKRYLAAIKEAQEAAEPEKVQYHGSYTHLMKIGEENPDKTFAEVNELWEEKKRAYNEWTKKQRKLSQNFSVFLKEAGFTSIHSLDEEYSYELDWGHRHGEKLSYEDTEVDTFPTPKEY